jgi:hypothetical protein
VPEPVGDLLGVVGDLARLAHVRILALFVWPS